MSAMSKQQQQHQQRMEQRTSSIDFLNTAHDNPRNVHPLEVRTILQFRAEQS